MAASHARRGSGGRPARFGPLRAALLVIVLTAALLAAAVDLAPENQLALGGAGLAAMLLAGSLRGSHPDAGRLLVLLIGAFVSLRYWLFRTTQTLGFPGPLDFVFVLLLYAAETYGIASHFFGMFVNLAPLARRSPPLPEDPERLPTVDVLVPTFDEPAAVVFVTLTACTQLDYPREKLNVYLLDDGATAAKLNDPDPEKALAARRRRAEFESMAARLGVRYLSRPDNRAAKAGNLNHGIFQCAGGDEAPGAEKQACINAALGMSCGELVLILDCDHVPTRDFLRRTVGFFLEDDNLAFVQTPHRFINPTAVERNLGLSEAAPAESEMFYGAVHPGLDLWNASFFCGSAALLRRRHLAAIGGISGQTVTEDAETALLLHARGHGSVYLNRPMAVGLSPETFEDFIRQRRRWAQGMVQLLRLKHPLRLPGLTPAQRLCYLQACLHWLFGPARVVFLAAPLLFLIAGLKVYNASLEQVLAYTLPHLAAAHLVANHLYGERRHPFFSELFETIQGVFLAPAVLAALTDPRRPKFRVTPKTAELDRDRLSPLAAPFYALFLLALAAVPLGLQRLSGRPLEFDAALICLAWNGFNLILILCCLGVVWNRRQLRRAHRHPTREPVILKRESGAYLPARLINLSLTGVAVAFAAEQGVADARLVMEAVDSDGRTTRLPLRVRRREAVAGEWVLGCDFEGAAERLEQIIGFVYGDSRRYRYFAEAGGRKPAHALKALALLIAAGLRGAGFTLWGISLFLLDTLRKIGVKTIRWRHPAIERESRHEAAASPPARPVSSGMARRPSGGGDDPHALAESGAGPGRQTAGDQGQPPAGHTRPRALEGQRGHPPV
jgi:cellulose synthase (UDP-forming)